MEHVEKLLKGAASESDIEYIARCYARAIIVYQQDDVNLEKLYKNFVSADMTFERFKEICGQAWAEKEGILVIMRDEPINSRYRIGFDQVIVLH